MLRLLSVALVVLFALSSVVSAKAPQEHKINLQKRNLSGEIPYQISNIVINGAPVEMGSSFSVGSTGNEWEKKMTFNFMNTSNKEIAHMFIKLLVPSLDQSNLGTLIPFFWFRSRTAGSVYPPFRGDQFQEMFQDIPDLRPRENLQIKLQEKYYEDFSKMIQKMGFSNSGEIKGITIWIDTLVFTDGTLWKSGTYFKPDPKDSSHWTPIEKVSSVRVDETGLASVSPPPKTSFCPFGHNRVLGFINCRRTSTGGPCSDSVLTLDFNTGTFNQVGWVNELCSDSMGRVCDSFPEPVIQECPLGVLPSR
jgi:hypothetical protein